MEREAIMQGEWKTRARAQEGTTGPEIRLDVEQKRLVENL